MEFLRLLRLALEKGSTDIIVTAGSPVFLRVRGELVPEGDPLTPEQVAELVFSLMTERQQARFEEARELDFALGFPGLGRFRFNAYYARGYPALVARPVPPEPRPLEELGLPENLPALLAHRAGLLLVAGPAGSGKSTTLAGMVRHINESRAAHIITIEDPIEYLHSPRRGTVSQREVGTDARSFATALRSALRQSPDVIVIGEVRDGETASTMLVAAETGHLVLASLHAHTAPEAVDRLLSLFPEEGREKARHSLAQNLLGVLVQQLVPSLSQEGHVLAYEMMVASPAVRNLVREGKTHQIRHHMVGEGMATMEETLARLLRMGKISLEEASLRAPDRRELLWRLNGVRPA